MAMRRYELHRLTDKVKVPELPKFDTLEDLLNHSQFDMVKTAFQIISKYKADNSLETVVFPELLQDIARVQAIQVELAGICGMLVAQAKRVEKHEDKVVSAIKNRLREESTKLEEDGEKVKATADELKDLSEELSMPHWQHNSKVCMQAEALKYIYYAIRDTGERLQALSSKMYDERFVGTQGRKS